MNWKETYTKIFLKNSNIALSDATMKEYLPLWWQNTRAKGESGLRLTKDGFDYAVDKADLQIDLFFTLATKVKGPGQNLLAKSIALESLCISFRASFIFE